MVESWLIEFVIAIGKVFLNPLLYWVILFMMIVGYNRVKRERLQFGSKVFDYFTERKNTRSLSICAGLVISLLSLGIGVVFTYETIMLLSTVIIILSIVSRFNLLSASYTIGITYLLILLSPLILENQSYVSPDLFANVNVLSLLFLLGIFLFVEAILLVRMKRNDAYPELSLSDRGIWIGQLRLKKLSLIPFFVLIPHGLISSFAPYWPSISIGEEKYGLLLVPFIIGFDHIVKGSLPQVAAKRLAKSISLLGVIVLAIAIGSIYVSWLSFVGIIIAILGKEYINYRHRMKDQELRPYFNQIDGALKVLAIIPGSPADRLQLLVGETIAKVNGQTVRSTDEFYAAVQASGASFKLDVLDDAGEVRFVQSAIYEGDHHKLGILFAKKPYRMTPNKKTA
ncbi:MAG TPA: PDZ domain-containing protein [Virgibacillus sp.]|nr:PDZ domain-containing protein [Virgibacillus sp.]